MPWKTTLFASLDNRVDASGDWQFAWFDEEYFGELSAIWDHADAIFVGATSFVGYEQLADTFPDSPVVHLIQSKPTYVVSSSRSASNTYPNARWLPDLSKPTLMMVEQQHENIAILGSPSVVIQLLETGSITQLNLAVMPIVLGTGAGLYDTATAPIILTSSRSRSLTSGTVLLDLNM